MNKRKIYCYVTGHDWHYVDRYLYIDLRKCSYCGELERIKNPTPVDGSDDHWIAFCTIHWFATGRKVVRFTPDETTNNMYNWFVKLQENENVDEAN